MIPDLGQIRAHFDAHGGLWRVIPKSNKAVQPRPFYVLLSIHAGPIGEIGTYDGGDLAGTADDAPWIRTAEWIPVDARGERLA
jgi:hypothetical protein